MKSICEIEFKMLLSLFQKRETEKITFTCYHAAINF